MAVITPEKLLNNRLTMLNQWYGAKQIDLDLYEELRDEIDRMKIERTTSEENIDSETEMIREEIVKAYKGELAFFSQIDIVVFDTNAIRNGEKELMPKLSIHLFKKSNMMKS